MIISSVDRIPDGITLSSLKPEHAKILKSDWANQNNAEELEGYFKSVIEKFESSCLLDKNGRILAYICMQYNGSIAMIYVLPEFRKEGYFDILVSDLTRKLLAKRDIAYGFIPFNDTSLINLSRKLGFEWVPQGNMTWTRFTPNIARRHQRKETSESKVPDVFSEDLGTLLKNQLSVIWRAFYKSYISLIHGYCYVICIVMIFINLMSQICFYWTKSFKLSQFSWIFMIDANVLFFLYILNIFFC